MIYSGPTQQQQQQQQNERELIKNVQQQKTI